MFYPNLVLSSPKYCCCLYNLGDWWCKKYRSNITEWVQSKVTFLSLRTKCHYVDFDTNSRSSLFWHWTEKTVQEVWFDNKLMCSRLCTDTLSAGWKKDDLCQFHFSFPRLMSVQEVHSRTEVWPFGGFGLISSTIIIWFVCANNIRWVESISEIKVQFERYYQAMKSSYGIWSLSHHQNHVFSKSRASICKRRAWPPNDAEVTNNGNGGTIFLVC